MKLSLTPRQK